MEQIQANLLSTKTILGVQIKVMQKRKLSRSGFGQAGKEHWCSMYLDQPALNAPASFVL